MSRRAAMRLNVHSEYTYTLETIIQAGRQGMAIESVPIRVNEDLRPSRLVKSIWGYVRRSLVTIVRIFATYKPTAFFTFPGVAFIAVGTALGLRFVYFYVQGLGGGHVQSLILTAVLLIVGFQLMLFGALAELQAVNRRLLEDIQWRTRRMDIEGDAPQVSDD
jgi:hypothetical protein